VIGGSDVKKTINWFTKVNQLIGATWWASHFRRLVTYLALVNGALKQYKTQYLAMLTYKW